MNYLNRMLILAALITAAAVPARADRDMLYVECRYIVGAANDSTAAEPAIKVWRLGPVYLRVEAPPNPETGEQVITIVSEKDTWTINTSTNKAVHRRDPSLMADIRVAVFPQASDSIRQLQYGFEKQFFDEHRATTLPDQKVNDTLCQVRQVTMDSARLTLYTSKATGYPVQVSMKRGDGLIRVRYDVYRPNLTPSLSLFTLPDSVTVVEGGTDEQ
jgi:hypothetical protein